jgi:formamidopyrimidine-DNA glycosylase
VPELPEVQTIVSELKTEILGKKIKNIEVKVPKMVLGDVKSIEALKVEDVRRRAKLIIIGLEKGLNLVIHLKLTGQLIYNQNSKIKIQKSKLQFKSQNGLGPTRVIFHFTDGSQLFFNDLRKFGYVKILDSQGLEKTLAKENYGPEPLEPQFTLEKFRELLSKRPNAQIKPLLMDQTFIAGIGNLYSDEILFYAGVHPKRRVKELRSEEVKKIYEGIGKILKEALRYKGSSIDTYRTTTGEKGTFEFHCKVYRREGQKCYRCGSIIKVIKIGGRSAHFCPKCQT